MIPYLQSRSNPQVKHWKLLRSDSTYRRQQGHILLVGTILIAEIARLLPLKKLIAQPTTELLDNLKAEEIIHVSAEVLKHITGLDSPTVCAAEIALPPAASLAGCHPLLALDGVADPGNLGTLFRTALALGWKGIFLLPGCCDPYNDKALRAARGAPLLLSHRHGTWEDLLNLATHEKLTALVAAMDGVPIKSCSAPLRPLLILGNEGRGAHPPPDYRWQRLAIPMHSHMESLNVATAGAILMHHLGNFRI